MKYKNWVMQLKSRNRRQKKFCESEGKENKIEENNKKFKRQGKSREYFFVSKISRCVSILTKNKQFITS
jgi:hypothetical protein